MGHYIDLTEMYRHTTHQQITYANLELLKGSYKVEPPPWSEYTVSARTNKEEAKKTEESDGEGEGQTEEISCNAFAKTKQLFRKREPSSVMADDLTEEDIFSIEPVTKSQQHQPAPVQKFQFDSFGCADAVPAMVLPRAAVPFKQVNIDLKGWNSSSFEIDFGKSVAPELNLPEHSGPKVNLVQSIKHGQTMQNSIKQFCFKIAGDQNNCLTATPIKKWSQLKKNNKKMSHKVMTQPTAADAVECHKGVLKKEMEKCMTALEETDHRHLTPKVVNDARELLEEVRDRLTGVRKKLNFEEETGSREEESSTMRMFGNTPLSSNKGTKRVQRADRRQALELTKSSGGRWKACEGKERVPMKGGVVGQKKVVKKEPRFRF